VKYRHAFHAGNFADVHKHVVLVGLLEALQRKDKGFLYVDTHAGEGLYDLRSHEARKAEHEAALGIERVRSRRATGAAPALALRYLELVERARRESGLRHAYPGSPWFAAALARPQDRAICCESNTEAFVALRRALRDAAHFTFENVDGYARLPALLPPHERRGLVLIDPPYEDGREDRRQLGQALELALRRFATGVYALWYPIKHEADTERWLGTLAARIGAPTLRTELWVHPRDSRVGLNGSGLLIVNPPYQLDEQLRDALPWLRGALAESTTVGGWSVGPG
jgi:23S rRNA (adenine2030-N6)-methyltransferase